MSPLENICATSALLLWSKFALSCSRYSRSSVQLLASTAVVYGILLAVPATANEVGPVAVPIKVGTVALSVAVRASFDIHPESGALALKGFGTGNLSEIQAKALAIVRSLPLPQDQCRHKGLNVVAEEIDTATLTASGPKAIIGVSGKVGVWACRKLFGAKLKTRLAAARVHLTVPVLVIASSPRTLSLRLAGKPTVQTDRPEIREAVEEVVGDVDTALALALQTLLDTSAARAKVPELNGVELDLTHASFMQDGTALLLRLEGTAKITPAALGTLLTQLRK